MKRCKGKSNLQIVRDYLDGVRPFTQISLNVLEKDKFRNEGETWEVDGIQYKKENGKTVRITKTQGDIIREAIGNSLACKKCNLQMKWGSSHDEKLIRRTGLCMECLTDYETRLRVLGIYDVYEKYKLASYEMGYLQTLKDKVTETLNYFIETEGNVILPSESEYDPNIVWKNTNRDQIVADAKKDLKHINELLKNGKKLHRQWKTEYRKSVKKYKLDFYE